MKWRWVQICISCEHKFYRGHPRSDTNQQNQFHFRFTFFIFVLFYFFILKFRTSFLSEFCIWSNLIWIWPHFSICIASNSNWGELIFSELLHIVAHPKFIWNLDLKSFVATFKLENFSKYLYILWLNTNRFTFREIDHGQCAFQFPQWIGKCYMDIGHSNNLSFFIYPS